MAEHTLITDGDAAVIADSYGMKILRWQPIVGGDENTSYLLSTDQGDFVLTFYEKKSPSGAEQNARLLKYLADHGFHTNQVVPDENGKLVTYYQAKTLVLKTWIPGDTLRDVPQTDYRSIGRALAKLHKIPAPDFLSSEHPYGLKRMQAALNQAIDLEYEDWLEDILGYIESNFQVGLTKALIHGDMFDDNIIYLQGQFQAIIDFGDACFYPRVYDLGGVLFGACMQDGKLNLEQSGDVLVGYQEISPLKPEERSKVQFFAVYAGAAISAWHYLNTFIRGPAGSRNEKYKAAAQRTEHIFHTPEETFNKILVNS